MEMLNWLSKLADAKFEVKKQYILFAQYSKQNSKKIIQNVLTLI